MKLSDAEEEDLEEAARRKPWMGNLASSSSSTSTRTNNAHEERSRVGGGSDVGGLYTPQDYDINPRRTKGTRQRYPRRTEWENTINALNLQPAEIKLVEMMRKRYQ